MSLAKSMYGTPRHPAFGASFTGCREARSTLPSSSYCTEPVRTFFVVAPAPPVRYRMLFEVIDKATLSSSTGASIAASIQLIDAVLFNVPTKSASRNYWTSAPLGWFCQCEWLEQTFRGSLKIEALLSVSIVYLLCSLHISPRFQIVWSSNTAWRKFI